MPHRLEHACLPAAIYAGGAASCVLTLAGGAPGHEQALAIGFTAAVAWMAYILDRAKIFARWHDPADRLARPERDAWVRAHRGGLLAGAAALATIGVVFALALRPWLATFVPAGAAAVIAYGSRDAASDRTRPKDVLLLKNALTAAAFATLACSSTSAAGIDPRAVASPGLFLACVVLGDAVLCDIEDLHADEAHRTRTVAVAAGPRTARTLGLGILALTATSWLVFVDRTPASAVIAAGLWLTATLAVWATHRVRIAIDLRMGVVALAAALIA
ncbi:MAG: UbiA family prenyltransferase [Planctomycetota bacterium]